jgi:exopolysaccharide production protein ExoZ
MGNGMARTGRLTWLQAMRFAAALLVVLHHAISLFKPLPFNFGLYGVLLFFTISGYVITGLLTIDPLKYVSHRTLRIYPAYLGSMVLAALVLGVTHVVPLADMTLARSMTLLPLGGPLSEWSRVPYWTLLYEIVFYAVVFVFICIGPRFFNLFLVFWAAIIVARNLVFHDYQPMSADLLTIFTSHLNICFITGAALARMHHARTTWPAALIVVIAFAPENWVGKESAYLGVLFAALIHVSVLAERYVEAPKPLIWLGDRSYGLYLAHNPGFAFLLTFPFALLPLWAALTALTIGSLLIGVAYGHLEFTFYGWGKRKLDAALARRLVLASGRDGGVAASPVRVNVDVTK